MNALGGGEVKLTAYFGATYMNQADIERRFANGKFSIASL